MQRATAQIAPGVTQSAARTANITGTVVKSDGTIVARADVRLTGPAVLSTTTDGHGIFAFTTIPWGTYNIAVNSPLGTAMRSNVVVNGDITVEVQYTAQSASGNLKEIARVATRNIGASINITPASIASVTPSAYAFQGNTSWHELLNKIPGVTVGGDLSTGNSLAGIIPDGPFYPIVLSINGSLPYETSTTLDGMPIVNTSFAVNGNAGSGTDLSYLPLSAFDTADVVRGPGANAPSIVDSIGGSFVLHAPGRIDSNRFEFSASNDAYGGTVANARAEVRFGKLSAFLSYGVNDSPGPLGSQSAITGSVPTILTVNGQAFAGCGPISCNFYSTGAPGYGSTAYQSCLCAFRNSLLLQGAPVSSGWTQHNGALALSYDITPVVTAQFFYAGSSSSSYRPPHEASVNFTPGAGYAGSIPAGLSTYLIASGGQDGLSPAVQSASLLEEKITAYVGHGVVRLAALQNSSFYQQTWPNNLPNGQYTLYGTGYYTAAPTTPVNFNGTSASLTFSPFAYYYAVYVKNRDLLASYDTQVGSRAHAGISYVTSSYNNPYCYWENVGAVFTGGVPSGISETTRELRFNVGADISDRLSLDASLYVARGTYHIMNPANTATWIDPAFPYSAPRFGAVWHVNQDTVIRGSAGGGFALPPLTYLVGSNAPPSCNVLYCSQTLTNVSLKPEESFGFDLGTDMRLRQNTVLSLDLYRTTLFGQFFKTTTNNGTYNGEPLCITQYNNLPSSRYEGINFDVRHESPKGIYWHGAIGLTRGYVVSVPAGFYNTAGNTCNAATYTTSCQNTYILPGANFNGKFLTTVPYATASAQIGYRWSSVKFIDLSPTYYGNNNSYYEPAFVEFDAHASYPLAKGVSLLATFRNITNIYGQSLEYFSPSMGVPTSAGLPYALFGLDYGPRSVVVTVNFSR